MILFYDLAIFLSLAGFVLARLGDAFKTRTLYFDAFFFVPRSRFIWFFSLNWHITQNTLKPYLVYFVFRKLSVYAMAVDVFRKSLKGLLEYKETII